MTRSFAVFALIAILFPAISQAESMNSQMINSPKNPPKEGVQPITQKWIGHISDDIQTDKKPRNILCYTKVDCRRKGQGFTTITFKPKALNSVSQYPAKNKVWSHEKQGYIQRKLYLD